MPRRKKVPLAKILNSVGRNKFERCTWDFLNKQGIKVSYERDKIPYIIEGRYNPDYTISHSKGTSFLETKGYFRPEAKRKMVAVKRCNPDLDIRLVFYSKNKTNIRWAEKNKFPYCFYTIPEEWLNEFRS